MPARLWGDARRVRYAFTLPEAVARGKLQPLRVPDSE